MTEEKRGRINSVRETQKAPHPLRVWCFLAPMRVLNNLIADVRWTAAFSGLDAATPWLYQIPPSPSTRQLYREIAMPLKRTGSQWQRKQGQGLWLLHETYPPRGLSSWGIFTRKAFRDEAYVPWNLTRLSRRSYPDVYSGWEISISKPVSCLIQRKWNTIITIEKSNYRMYEYGWQRHVTLSEDKCARVDARAIWKV